MRLPCPAPRETVIRVRATRRLQAGLVVLLVIGLIVNGAVLVLFARSLSGIRGDFCSWTRDHYAASLQQPQTASRVSDEEADMALLRQLGCPGGGK
jgi:hypothetical protein